MEIVQYEPWLNGRYAVKVAGVIWLAGMMLATTAFAQNSDPASEPKYIEAFYNLALMPAIRLSFHAQHMNSANPEKDNAFVLASRLQLDF